MSARLELVGVSAGYHDIRALWDVSLTVEPGSLTAVLGRNGAGKTTLLSAIAGLVDVSSGSINFDGQNVGRQPAYRRTRLGIGFVQENKRIFRNRTVEENLRLGGFWALRRRAEMEHAIKAACDRFPVLGEKLQRPASTLSGGEQQMLAIAQALMPSPAVVMLDEPSAGLAPEVAARVFKSIAQLKDEGICVLLVEQTIHRALLVADRVAVLELGRLVSNQPIQEVDEARIQDVYFGTPA